MLNLNDFADALKTIAPNSIVHTAVLQQEIDLEVKSVTLERNIKSFTRVSNIIEMSGFNSSFFENWKRSWEAKIFLKLKHKQGGRTKISYGIHVEEVL